MHTASESASRERQHRVNGLGDDGKVYPTRTQDSSSTAIDLAVHFEDDDHVINGVRVIPKARGMGNADHDVLQFDVWMKETVFDAAPDGEHLTREEIDAELRDDDMPAAYQPTQTEKDLVGNKPKWALYQQYLSSSPLTPSTPWPSDNTATLTVAQAEEWAEQHARRYRTGMHVAGLFTGIRTRQVYNAMDTSAHRQYIMVRRRIEGHTMALLKAVEAGNTATRADLEATLDQLRAKARTLQASARAQAAADKAAEEQAERDEYADAAKTGDAKRVANLERAALASSGHSTRHASKREVRPEDLAGKARVRESLALFARFLRHQRGEQAHNTAAVDEASRRDGQQRVAAYTAAVTGKNNSGRHRPT